ncbi:hypothetical protein BGZ74_006343 [Mortierella antarctica]|nr:hypothetical protein BGZ74_006343 [Mortierella antarctica]
MSVNRQKKEYKSKAEGGKGRDKSYFDAFLSYIFKIPKPFQTALRLIVPELAKHPVVENSQPSSVECQPLSTEHYQHEQQQQQHQHQHQH